MTAWLYILYSASLNCYYTGISRFKPKRMRQHNRGQGYWTSRADDWVEFRRGEADSMSSTRALERRIKTRGAERFLGDLGIAPSSGSSVCG
jgi:putative endonuclease